MRAKPPGPPGGGRSGLRARFDEAAIVELTAAVAFENYRGRFNHALGIGSEGFCSVPLTANGQPAPKEVLS